MDAAFLLTVGSFLLTVEFFLLTVDNFSFFTYSWSFFAYSCSFFAYSWSSFAYSKKVRLIGALKDCKQRSLTVSKNAPTVTKKASPFFVIAKTLVLMVRNLRGSQGGLRHRWPSTGVKKASP